MKKTKKDPLIELGNLYEFYKEIRKAKEKKNPPANKS